MASGQRPLFDRIAIVDWSASSTRTTGADSIWIGVVEGDRCELDNLGTRRDALDALATLRDRPGRSLVGVDFSLGYPAGTAAAWGVSGPAWRSTWAMLGAQIRDDDRNANNRFDVASELNAAMPGRFGPFWGCPPSRRSATLASTKPEPDPRWPATWRHVEAVLRGAGHRPFSAWQLLGAGSVGSQSLMGIAALERLRWNLGEDLAIWPFTTGLTTPSGPARLVVAEVWPSLWPVEVPPGVVKDAAQVEATARRLARCDADGELAAWFAPAIDRSHVDDIVDEEGWVLGAGTAVEGRPH